MITRTRDETDRARDGRDLGLHLRLYDISVLRSPLFIKRQSPTPRLGGCRRHGQIEVASNVREKILENLEW